MRLVVSIYEQILLASRYSNLSAVLRVLKYGIGSALHPQPDQTYYVNDIMCWKGQAVYDCAYEFRMFWVRPLRTSFLLAQAMFLLQHRISCYVHLCIWKMQG